MAFTRIGGSWANEYVALSTDEKYTKATHPDVLVPNGSSCLEIDTGTIYLYDRENDLWCLVEIGEGGGGSGGTTNYNNLNYKPKINGVELSGNKTTEDLHLETTAGSIAFDETTSYEDGSVGKELSDQKNAINQKAPLIINSASGDVASFADGADAMPFKKIVGTIVTPEGGSGWTGCILRNATGNYITATPIRRISKASVNASSGLIENSNYRDLLVYPIPKGTLWLVKESGERYDGLSNNPNLVKGDTCNQSFYTRWSNQNKLTNNYSYLYVQGPLGSGIPYISVSSYNPDSVLPAGEVIDCPIDWQTEAGTILNGTVTLNEDGSADIVNSDTEGTYHLTDVGRLLTFSGENNVWIDTGAISECDYPADTKLYIDGLTAPDEDMIANANIASGKYFVVNNQLYLSTAAIAAGASIVPGTNCTATNLAEALNALNT